MSQADYVFTYNSQLLIIHCVWKKTSRTLSIISWRRDIEF